MGTIFEKIYFYIFLFYFISFGKFIGLCMKCIRNVNHHFESNKIQDQKKKCYRERAFKDYAMWLYKIYSVFFYFFYKNLKKIVIKKKMLNPFFMSPRKIYFTTVTPFVFIIFICSPLLLLNIKTFLFPSNIESRLLQQPHMTHTSKIIKRRKKKTKKKF